MPSLKDTTVLIVGRGSGIARAIAMAVSEDGRRVTVAGCPPRSTAASTSPERRGRHP
jgi:NAD(P)-dependent dehydrogenase (short-subunit alcohol dehydrogenase family)